MNCSLLGQNFDSNMLLLLMTVEVSKYRKYDEKTDRHMKIKLYSDFL